MASGKSNFKTPDQPNRVKRDVTDPSPNLNMVYQTLPDLTPPRKNKYSDPFSTIGTAGASPSGTEFGFPRPNDSSPGAFRSGSDGKSDPVFDLFGFRSTPAKGRSPVPFDLSSPRSTGLQPPPVPIFQPSPRRASDASTYISPDSRNIRRSSLTSSGAGGKAFSFSPQPAFASPTHTSNGAGGASGSGNAGGASNTNVNGGHASFTSVFASILGDAHSRISPTNLSAVAAAARDGSAVRAHFGGIFAGADAAAAAAAAAAGGVPGVSTNGNSGVPTASGAGGAHQPGSSSLLVPVDGLLASGGSPLQLHSGRGTPLSGGDGGNEDREDDNDEDNDGYDAVAARRPSRRRALDFDGAAAVDQGNLIGGVNNTNTNNNDSNTNNNVINSNDDALKYEIGNPLQSPSIGAVAIDSIDALLPIARLRGSGSDEEEDEEGAAGRARGGERGGMYSNNGRAPMLVPSSTRGVSGTTAGGVSLLPGLTRGTNGASTSTGMSLFDLSAQSPISMRPGIIRREDIIDSPAVKEATNAAVAAALQANERRPARAAAAGAAAAAAAAAGGTPMSRRPSAAHHAAGISSGLFDASGLLSAANGGVPAGGIRCNCKKSRCMKLYCDCFKALGYCGEGCSCVGCSNREDNAPAVNQARESILQRNPQAFIEKISTPIEPSYGGVGGGIGALGTNGFLSGGIGGLGASGGGGGAQHRRGCNCKKSKCLKKYCECFQAGIACGDSCKCDGCHNTTEMMAAGKPPFDKKRIQQQQQQSLVQQPVQSIVQQVQQMQQQQQQQLNSNNAPGAVPGRGGENGNQSQGSGGSGTVSTAPAKTAGTTASAAQAAAAAATTLGLQQQAFAALGPAFQQILLQRAFTGNGNNSGGAGTPPGQGQGGKPGSLTVNNQLLVPISWPLGAAAANGGGGAAPGTAGAVAPNNATAQQLLNLAQSGAIPAFSSQVAAAVAAAQQNAANVAAVAKAQAAAQAAAAVAAASKNTKDGKTTPSIGPSSQEEPSSAAAGTTTTATEQEQPSDGTDGTATDNPTRQAAVLEGGMSQQQQQGAESSHRNGVGGGSRRKPPLPPSGSAGVKTAAAAATGSGTSDEDAKPRLTPTKRKPARTMTAALM